MPLIHNPANCSVPDKYILFSYSCKHSGMFTFVCSFVKLKKMSANVKQKRCATSAKGLVVPADIKVIAKNIDLIPNCIEIIAG